MPNWCGCAPVPKPKPIDRCYFSIYDPNGYGTINGIQLGQIMSAEKG